jgi:hypothetical protein
MKNTELLNDLIKKQRKNISYDKRLNFNELKRMCKYIDGSLFDESKCCLWTGYVTNLNNPNKGIYINFYFRGKKPVLHRLLYTNFVDDLNDNEYLKFTCPNKGICCNVKHLQKFIYIHNHDSSGNKPESKQEPELKKPDKINIVGTPIANIVPIHKHAHVHVHAGALMDTLNASPKPDAIKQPSSLTVNFD